MAYDPPYRGQDDESTERLGGARHRSPTTTAASPVPGYPQEEYPGTGFGQVEPVPASELATVFDDPAAGEPGRDRLAVHWLWELVLLLGVAGLAYLLWSDDPGTLRGDSLTGLLVTATGFGLLGLAAGITLRAGVPNLAIGPAAAAAGVYFAQQGAEGVLVPTAFSVGLAVLAGVVMALLITVFHVPGWAVSLAAVAGAVVWLQLQPPDVSLTGGYDPSGHAAFLFAGVAAIGILGGLLGSVPSMRRRIGRFRPVGDPADRRGGTAVLVVGVALVVSLVFSVVAGVVLVAGAQLPAEGSVGVNWLLWTVIGFGVALAGGTSAFGRRGGVLGTVLAVVALVLFHRFQQEQGWGIALLATAAGAVLVGLLATRLVERFGRPRVSDEPREWAAAPVGPPVDGADASPTESWSTTLPARPAPAAAPAPWDDDHWNRQ